MYRSIKDEQVIYNHDNPDNNIITEDKFSLKKYLFGIKIVDIRRNIFQDFDKTGKGGKPLGF